MYEDITGLRSGKLTAIRPTSEKRRGCTLWLCRCDCGREVQEEAYKIRAKRVLSCGCSRKGQGMKDLSGQRFGRLTALERTSEKIGSSYLWLCRCDCGKEVLISTNALLCGGTKSCGCGKIMKLRDRAKNLEGKKFGYLTALAPTEDRFHGSVVWKCQCDCGKVCEVPYNSLVSGNTASCGCKKKEHDPPALHYIDNTCIEMIDQPILRKDNTSGYTGVMAARNGSWKAEITFQGKRYGLGSYRTIREAARARQVAESRLFGEYLNYYYSSPENASAYEKRMADSEEDLTSADGND